MSRRFTGDRLVIASHNRGKVREIGDLVRSFTVDVVAVGDLGLPEPEETGETFIANAELKAIAAAQGSGMPALADDSGLVVPALGGAPGVMSARWAGPSKDFRVAMSRVERALAGIGDQRAHFACALVLAWPDGHRECFEGVVHGRLVFPPRGEHGFGYDPIFIADGRDITFGEMDPAEKHRISHRADAFRKMVAACFGDD
jgi:XTP/dITP diphosphohydrolase